MLEYQEKKPKGEPRKLIMFLHGYGSNGEDLIELAPFFQSIIPEAYCLSPNAPSICEEFPFGYQWFSLQNRDYEAMYKLICPASEMLVRFINLKLEESGLTLKDLILVGFSQGAMMAMHTALRLEEKITAAIAFSGALIGPEYLAKDIKSHPPISLIHGNVDEVVPVMASKSAHQLLQQNNVNTKLHIIQGVGHGISMEALHAAGSDLHEWIND